MHKLDSENHVHPIADCGCRGVTAVVERHGVALTPELHGHFRARHCCCVHRVWVIVAARDVWVCRAERESSLALMRNVGNGACASRKPAVRDPYDRRRE